MVTNDVPARAIPPPLGPISIVFTDIVKSTDIWEKNTSAMISAMKLHDDTVRSLTLSNNGYEVKQNGDGFMIAFPTATSAVQFCLDVQEKLLDEEWPKALLKLGPGQETTDEEGHVLFRGLQLRMSAHWGEPVSKWNEVIQRMDYLGPVVNRAARFVQVTEGGQIVVSEDFLVQLQHEMQRTEGRDEDSSSQRTQTQPLSSEASTSTNTDVNANTTTATTAEHSPPPDLGILRSKTGQKNVTTQNFQIRELGDYEFQGLDDPQKLYFIVPRSLEGRVEHWHQVMHVSGVKGNVKTE
jgi:adenylate cyclase